MKIKKTPLTLSVTLQLTSQEDNYSHSTIVNSEKKCVLILNSDSPKRKIIDAVEGEVEALLSEMSRTVHHSTLLTDGEVARAEADKE